MTAEGDLLWIDGELVPEARNLAFHRDAIAANELDTWRSHALSLVREDLRDTVLCDRSSASTGPFHRVQVRFAAGSRALLGLSCRCVARQDLRSLLHLGMFFELQQQPSPQLGPAHRGTTEIELAIDGMVALDPIIAASLEQLPGPGRGPWTSSLLRLWLTPGHSPSRFLSSLCQRRAARRLLVRLDGVCFSLEELGVLRASLIAPTEVPWNGPASGDVALEFVLESRPPIELARAPELEQPPSRLAAIHDSTLDSRRRERLLADLRWLLRLGSPPDTRWILAEPLPQSPKEWAARIRWSPAPSPSGLELVAFTSDAKLELAPATAALQLGAERWKSHQPDGGFELRVRIAPIDEALPVLERLDAAAGVRWPGEDRLPAALARAHDDGLTGAVAELLDREGCYDRDAWTVFADHLQQRGDARGELLARLASGDEPAALEPEIMAVLDERERLLRMTPPGGRLRFGDREWSPRVWATWVGPMIVQLAVEPDWTRVVEDDGLPSRDRMRYGAVGRLRELLQRPPPSVGQLLGLQTWHGVPGYDAIAELARLLELPCFALLSPQRILRAGLDGKPGRVSALDMSGTDLRGINLCHSDMHDCNLRGANLSGARIERMRFVKCDLRDVELRGAVIDDWCEFQSCDLRGAKWQEAKMLRYVRSKQILADPELAARLELLNQR